MEVYLFTLWRRYRPSNMPRACGLLLIEPSLPHVASMVQPQGELDPAHRSIDNAVDSRQLQQLLGEHLGELARQGPGTRIAREHGEVNSVIEESAEWLHFRGWAVFELHESLDVVPGVAPEDMLRDLLQREFARLVGIRGTDEPEDEAVM